MQPNLEHMGPVPIYEQIKAWMRQQVTGGAWPGHHKLKAEADLAVELGVSRGTVRKANSDLIEEGLLVRSHGRGTFVAANRLEQPLAERLITFSEDLISRGIPFETLVLEQAVVQASSRVANMLDLVPSSPVFFLKRLRLVEQAPLILLHNYVVYDRCPGIEALDFTHYRLFEALEERYGLALDYGRRSFEAQGADKELARWLGIARRDPIIYMEQLTHLQDGGVIEFSELWLRGDRFKLSAVVKRNNWSDAGLAISISRGHLEALEEVK